MDKRFTDVWCSETGQIGLTDNGVDKTFYSHEFEDFLNHLSDDSIQDFTLHCVECEIKKLIENNKDYQKFAEQEQDRVLYLISENRILVLYELLANVRRLKTSRKDYLEMIKGVIENE